ncbi:hypothetical protein ACOMHN_019731 [Nucella lapillus]
MRQDVKELANTYQYPDPSTPNALEQMWSDIKQMLSETVEKRVPSKTSAARHTTPWITTSIRRAIRRKQRAHKKARMTGKKKDVDRVRGMADEKGEPPCKKRTSSDTPVHYSTSKWLEENKQFFKPPVCNKMMHSDGQMKVFYVGGPNERKDFHIEEGEELFYMLKGDMTLRVLEQGEHKDIPVRHGEIFLLPARIPHSPQRQENTVGMVIERERAKEERDGLRYYVEKEGKLTTESLFEEWFHCEDLGTQLAPIIKKYFDSEQHKTGKPVPGTIPKKPPITPNSEIALEDPFDLKQWIAENRTQLNTKGSIQVFGDPFQFQVTIYGKGKNKGKNSKAETFILQVEGKSTVTVEGKEYTLEESDTLLVRVGQEYKAKRGEGSMTLICFQDPTRTSM